ncbi:MAG: tetratricopeptide repeat protein [Gammaproteobacteria bacterium]|jgi:tetratricopeptide (TPR) repeat protein
MSLLYRLKLLTLITLLLAGPPAMAGDAASALPESLAGSLRSIQEVRLDDLDTQARDSIQLARRQLNEALQAQPVQLDMLAAAYGELGGLYLVHAAFPAAEDCYHNAGQLAPDEFRWAYYAAYLAEKDGRTRLALDRYRHAQTLDTAYMALMLRLGNILLDLNELEQAQTAFQQVVNAVGLEAASLYGLGQIALLRRDYDTAIDAFTRALEYDPAASRIHYPLAQALRAIQRNDEAKARLALRGDQPPSFRDPLIEGMEALKIGSRFQFLQAMRAIKRQDYAAASKAFAEGLSGEPDNVQARISYARTLYLVDNRSGARQALEAALAMQPDNSLGLFLLGILAEEAGDTDKAVAYYRLAIRYTPDHTGAHQYLADLYYRQGNYTAAAEHYASSIRGEPSNLAATIPYIGTLLLTDAPAATLMAALETAIDRFPEYPGFKSLQILLLAGSRNPEIQDPETALKYAQQLNDQYRIPPHQELLALAYAASGDYPQAVSIQEELLSYARRAMPGEADRVALTLDYYQDKTLPPLDELINYAALGAQGFNVTAAFRDYPAARPY